MNLALFAAALVSSPAWPWPQQFDLVCGGTRQWKGVDPLESGTAPVAFRIHVDLDEGRYCIDRCQTSENVRDVNSDQIGFGRTKVGPNDPAHSALFQRKSGLFNLILIWDGDALSLDVKARCRIGPMTGLSRKGFRD